MPRPAIKIRPTTSRMGAGYEEARERGVGITPGARPEPKFGPGNPFKQIAGVGRAIARADSALGEHWKKKGKK